MYNVGQKLTSQLMKEAPLSQLVDFVQSATTQERNKQEPCVPTEYQGLMKGVVRNPQVPTTEPVLVRRTPVKFQCAKCLLPRFERAHVEKSVILFSETTMNEARAAAKEIVQSHVKESVQLLCALHVAHEKQGRRRCPPVSLNFLDWAH